MAKEFEGAISGDAVEEMVKTAAGIHDSEHKSEILDGIKDAVTLCKKQGKVLQELFEENSLSIHVPMPNSTQQDHNWAKVEKILKMGKAVLVFVKLPEGQVKVFAIVPKDREAYVLHGLKDYAVQAGSSMAIDEMISLLKDLHSHDYTKLKASAISVAHDICKRILGSDHIGSSEPVKCQDPVTTTIEAVLAGLPQVPLDQCEEKLGSLSVELAKWCNVASQTTKDPAMFRAAFGFVFGSSGALKLDDGDSRITSDEFDNELKGAVARGGGQIVGGAVARAAAPGIARIGACVVRANAAAGAAMFGVIALWDVARWAQNDITAVQLRKSLAEGAAGAAGGVAGGIALGAAGGLALGPVGAFVGGVVGGIAGGLAGGFAGKAIDNAIWDEGEDTVMESYEFFGWRGVSRGNRPRKSEEEVRDAYLKKLDEKPSSVDEKDWAKYCTAMLMVLLRAMYPELKQMFEIAEDLNESKTKAVKMIGTGMYSSLEEEENH